MSEAVQEILRPAIDTNPHTTLLRAGIDTDNLQRTLQNSAAPKMFFEGGRSGQDFTVARARRPPGCYFDTLPTLAIFFIHISAILTPSPVWVLFPLWIFFPLLF